MPIHKKKAFLLRPQSAISSKRSAGESASRPSAPTKTIRPWTATGRQRGEVSSQKVVRQPQYQHKSHLKAVARQEREAVQSVLAISRTSAELNENSLDFEVVTMVATKTPEGIRRHAKEPASKTAAEETKRNSPKKRHPSFDTWLSGSPHASDEYDTDLEETEETTGKETRRTKGDASGLNAYEERCKKHGLVPVSFLRRHLGKRIIRMRHHYLGGQAARPLAYALSNNTVTEMVDFSDNFLEATGAASLAAMLNDNMFIVSMNLSDNFIGSYGCSAIADMLDVNTTLKELILAGNQLTDMDAYHLIEPLRNNMSLTSLDLSHNGFSEMAGLHLGAVLTSNDGLIDLDLSWNSIRKKGAVALANALKVNTVLEVLDLSWNGIGAEGTVALQSALQVNNTLRVLDLTARDGPQRQAAREYLPPESLRNNRIDIKSAVKLAAGLKRNFGLETLILNLNPIGDEGMDAIVKAAATHQNLKFLSLEDLGINQETFQGIERLLDSGMTVLYGGSGGYQRHSSLIGLLVFFRRFIHDHNRDLETAFEQQDKDYSDILTAEEIKQCLRTAGLRLTSRQMDQLIEEIDFSHNGRIPYRSILSGHLFAEYERKRPTSRLSRAPERPTSGLSHTPGMQTILETV